MGNTKNQLLRTALFLGTLAHYWASGPTATFLGCDWSEVWKHKQKNCAWEQYSLVAKRSRQYWAQIRHFFQGLSQVWVIF